MDTQIRLNDDLPDNSITLELGDIIEILSPTNNNYHEKTFIIKYIDQAYMEIMNISYNELYNINFTDDGFLSDESIVQMNILDRSKEKGFARQNNLLPNRWINIHFIGDIPIIITGEITDIEDDMIEVMTYPDRTAIYLDFAYRGLPNNIPIEKIIIRQKPITISPTKDSMDGESIDTEDPIPEASIEFTETNESIINIPENNLVDENIRETLNDLYVNANTLVFGEKLEDFKQLVEIPENEQRYSIDAQVNDLMDELLSTIPNHKRTDKVMNNIHNLIERFKQLRANFSLFDNNANAYDVKKLTAYHKPLIEKLKNISHDIKWLIPVVQNKKRLYDDSVTINDMDYEINSNQTLLDDIISIQTQYTSLNQLKYLDSQLQLDEQFNLFDNSSKDCLITQNVNTNLDTIIDNFGDFYSSVMKENELHRQQFVIQRYNLSSKRIKEEVLNSGKKLYKKVNLTNNDEMCIKSYLMLPEPFIQHSKINLPNTNLIEKSNLHHNKLILSYIFKNETDIIPHVIDDLSKEFDYIKMEKDTEKDVFANFHEFLLDENILDDDKYTKFLETIIPKTKILIRLINKYATNKLSFHNYLQTLEPFSVYSNDISYKQYNDIRYFVKEQIKNYKIQYETRYKEYLTIQNNKRNNKNNEGKKKNDILHLINEKESDIAEAFLKHYKINNINKEVKMNSHETLLQILNHDNGNLYNTIISSILVSLVTPENILGVLMEPNIEEDDYKKVSSKDCSTRYLAKKYSSIKELTDDNNVEELYYDEKLDDTPYEIIEKYASERKSMSVEVFFGFLKENLIQKHNTSSEVAEELTRSLIANKKGVKEGNYAVLEIKPKLFKEINETELSKEEKQNVELEANVRAKKIYYHRINHNWVKDDSINDIDFIDTNTIFCNLKNKCIKNPVNKICESNDENIDRNLNLSKKSLLNEFNKRYTFSVEEIEAKIEKDLDRYLKMLKKHNNLLEVKTNKANNIAYELSKLVSDTDVLLSPHLYLRDLILGQDDFIKKQKDISLFVEKYCREPLTDLEENQNWKYCIDTNTPLFPNSVFLLAKSFTLGEDYTDKLAEVCRQYGVLSDDGDSIVDKYSGFVLRKLDFSTEEGYDESGFKITSHSILENNLGDTIMQETKKTKIKIFEDETNELIYMILTKFCDITDINIENIETFVLTTSNTVIRKKILSEKKYNEKLEKDKQKAKKSLSGYDKYRNEMIILIVSSMFLIAIQTAIPTISSKRTVYSCIKSFNGYPLRGIEDLSSIQYIACMLTKINTQVAPWNAIKKADKDKMSIKLKSIIDFIVEQEDVKDLYHRKEQYLSLNPHIDIPPEHTISKWKLFNPPLLQFSIIKRLQNVANGFQGMLIDAIKNGDKKQNEYINIVKVKQREISYGIIESINNIVKENELLLKTSGLVPFVENACCNDNLDSTNPLLYFSNIDNNIINYITKIKSNSQLLKDVKLLSNAPFFYHTIPTNIQYPEIPKGQLMENIYAAIIYYCNFDRDLPIPSYLHTICDKKPTNYSKKWSIEEKIEFLKKNGKQYNVTDLNSLLKIIQNQNKVQLEDYVEYKQIDAFNDIIEKIEGDDTNIIAPPLIQLLKKVISEYNPKALSNTHSEGLKDLINYLDKSNTKMLDYIFAFFKKHSTHISDKEYNEIVNFLSKINKWKLEDNDTTNKCHVNNEGLHSYINFILNSLQSFCRTYPNTLQKETIFEMSVPKHWDLSDKHANDLIEFNEKYFNNLKQFNGDQTIMQLLQQINLKLKDIYYFASNIPIYTEITKDIKTDGNKEPHTFHCLFDKSSLYLLYTHCIYSVLYEYINLTDDSQLLQLDIIENKQTRIEQRNSQIDDSNFTYSDNNLNENTAESYTDLQEIQILQGTRVDLKNRICSLLFAYLNIENKTKDMIDTTYDDIMKKVNRSREAEKERIFSYFSNMIPEHRKVEDKLKKYKLGRWNIGLQTGIYKYNKQTYDQEGFENEKIDEIYVDAPDSGDPDIDEMGDDEVIEANDISNLGDNFTDGVFYEEDQDYDE
tara:strand:- start:10977 stop:17027 length:6051 start_codon:yes stop_codon:yes gene_type:complete